MISWLRFLNPWRHRRIERANRNVREVLSSLVQQCEAGGANTVAMRVEVFMSMASYLWAGEHEKRGNASSNP